MEEGNGQDLPLKNQSDVTENFDEADEDMEFDDILDQVGAFGHWQRVIFVLISAMDIMGALAIIIPVYTGATPKWKCADIEYSSMLNVSENVSLAQCAYNSTHCTTWIFFDDFTSIVSEWDLVCSRAYISDLITSIQMVGLLFGSAIFGQLSDSLGRKKSYYLAYTIMIGFGALSAASVNWQMYAALRFFVGIGFAGTMVVNCVYTVEFVGPRWRTICGTVGFWAMGIMLMALLAYLVRGWRHLTLISTAPGVVYYITWLVIPESPRWLKENGRLQECRDIVTKIAKKNGKPVPDMSKLKKFSDTVHEIKRKYTYLDLFRIWQYARQTLIMLVAWFTVMCMYYHLTYSLRNLAGDRYINLLLGGIVDLFSVFTVILFNNTLGRRWTFTLFMSLTVVCNVCLLIIHVTNAAHLEGLVRGAALLGKGAALSGSYSLQIITAELFPTVIRSVAMGAGSICGRIGGILSPQMVYLGTIVPLAPYIIFTVLCCLTLPLTFMVPETNGKPLLDPFAKREERKSNMDTHDCVKPINNENI